MRDFVFFEGWNDTKRCPQLKMLVQEGEMKTIFVVDNRTTLWPKENQLCRGVEMRSIVDKPNYRMISVDVKEIVEAEMPKTTPVLVSPIETSKPIPASVRGIKARAVFYQTDSGPKATVVKEGRTAIFSPDPTGPQPKADERWQIRMDRLRPVVGQDLCFTAFGILLKRLPDLAPEQKSSDGVSLVQLAQRDAPEIDTVDTDHLLDLTMVRGANKARRVQWQQYVTDDIALTTTLYVGNDRSTFQPSMGGERWLCCPGKTIHPKPETEMEFDKGGFRIVLVDFITKLEVDDVKVVGHISRGNAKGRAEREHRREERRAELKKMAPKGVIGSKPAIGGGKSKKSTKNGRKKKSA